MKTTIIDGVKVTKDDDGNLTIHIPTHMNGTKYAQWRIDNKGEIEEFKYGKENIDALGERRGS